MCTPACYLVWRVIEATKRPSPLSCTSHFPVSDITCRSAILIKLKNEKCQDNQGCLTAQSCFRQNFIFGMFDSKRSWKQLVEHKSIAMQPSPMNRITKAAKYTNQHRIHFWQASVFYKIYELSVLAPDSLPHWVGNLVLRLTVHIL